MKPLRAIVWIAALLALLTVGGTASAHKASDAYLTLTAQPEGLSGQWDIALRDLELAVGLDTSGDGAITWGELKAARGVVESYAFSHLSLASGGQALHLSPQALLFDEHSDGGYAVLTFTAEGAVRGELEVGYTLLFELDAQHRGLLSLNSPEGSQTAVFTPGQAIQRLSLTAPSALAQFKTFVWEGAHHIWIGYDHVLFLLALLLPAVLERRGGRLTPREELRPALSQVVWVVTSFTLAHSLTLAAAALGLAQLPSRLVESAIAASILVAVLHIHRPLWAGREWIMALCFGLIHGFGFASVLMELGLTPGGLVRSLVGFNLGVELGQLAIVAVFVPLAWLTRKSWFYQGVVVRAGSVAIATAALIWLVERALDVTIWSG